MCVFDSFLISPFSLPFFLPSSLSLPLSFFPLSFAVFDVTLLCVVLQYLSRLPHFSDEVKKSVAFFSWNCCYVLPRTICARNRRSTKNLVRKHSTSPDERCPTQFRTPHRHKVHLLFNNMYILRGLVSFLIVVFHFFFFSFGFHTTTSGTRKSLFNFEMEYASLNLFITSSCENSCAPPNRCKGTFSDFEKKEKEEVVIAAPSYLVPLPEIQSVVSPGEATSVAIPFSVSLFLLFFLCFLFPFFFSSVVVTVSLRAPYLLFVYA